MRPANAPVAATTAPIDITHRTVIIVKPRRSVTMHLRRKDERIEVRHESESERQRGRRRPMRGPRRVAGRGIEVAPLPATAVAAEHEAPADRKVAHDRGALSPLVERQRDGARLRPAAWNGTPREQGQRMLVADELPARVA